MIVHSINRCFAIASNTVIPRLPVFNHSIYFSSNATTTLECQDNDYTILYDHRFKAGKNGVYKLQIVKATPEPKFVLWTNDEDHLVMNGIGAIKALFTDLGKYGHEARSNRDFRKTAYYVLERSDEGLVVKITEDTPSVTLKTDAIRQVKDSILLVSNIYKRLTNRYSYVKESKNTV